MYSMSMHPDICTLHKFIMHCKGFFFETIMVKIAYNFMPFRTYWSIVQEHCNFEIVEILHGWQVIGIHDQTSCPWSWKFVYLIILWDRVVRIMEGCRKRWEVWIQLRFILGLRIIHSLLFPRSLVLCSTPKLLLKAFYNLKFCCLDKSCLSLKNHNVLWLFFSILSSYIP